MLTVNNISHYKNQQKIFNNLGFTVGLGSILLLTGKNGSGKTSLLRILAGLTSPSQGEILWNKENIKQIYQEYKTDLQYIGHKNFLRPELTVLENLEFYAALSDTEILIPSAVRYFGLEPIIDQKAHKLSAGWQKRVILSRLLYSPTTLWLLDEPSVNLDKEGKELLFNLISLRIRDGGIALIATHDEILLSLSSKLNLEDFFDN